ncbi:iron-containing redox enzyme family protein [Arthrobacter sp. Br18]|uniref:iron-containing redox enzyme family protein n=1 Tax=Arthrobacter sp. Br18 TaxID=1312954 RepID=UPI0004794B4F|nr:iron-containing redox enzyme family protein [Arthrobacter sp. Br18]
MKQPSARGTVSELVLGIITGVGPAQPALDGLPDAVDRAVVSTPDLLFDDDLQLALFCLYELHYSGIDGASTDWEWNPTLIGARGRISAAMEARIRQEVALGELPAAKSEAVAAELFRMTGEAGGPSMSRFVAKEATDQQLREFLINKSIYQLKEADPHTFAIPRLTGRAKAALVEIQADEYGGGRPARMHSALFAKTLRELDLDDTYGAYLDTTPAITLASSNLMSLFGLSRRLRGAAVGHLAVYEMTSSQPNRLYSRGFKRHGYSEEAREYFDEHVEADAVHEQIASRDMAGGLVESEPDLLEDVLFGAAAALYVDGLMTVQVMDAWAGGRTSLLHSAASPV